MLPNGGSNFLASNLYFHIAWIFRKEICDILWPYREFSAIKPALCVFFNSTLIKLSIIGSFHMSFLQVSWGVLVNKEIQISFDSNQIEWWCLRVISKGRYFCGSGAYLKIFDIFSKLIAMEIFPKSFSRQQDLRNVFIMRYLNSIRWW